MKVFVTGATGFIGSAVVKELITAGHQVLGLARTPEAAQKLLALGAETHYGDLTNPESLIEGAKATDGVIHLGFIHDFSRFPEVCAIDRVVIETIGQALIGTEKPFIVTSGTAVIAKDGLLTEEDRLIQVTNNPRSATELAVDVVASKGVKVAVVRLPPSVHGDGDKHGFVPILINIAKENGKVAVINNGSNLWPAVHRLDAAKVFRLVLEKVVPSGTRFHAVGENGIPMKKIAENIASKLNLPLVSLSQDEAQGYFTWFSHFAEFNNPSSNKLTSEILNWQPNYPSLLEDLNDDLYFTE